MDRVERLDGRFGASMRWVERLPVWWRDARPGPRTTVLIWSIVHALIFLWLFKSPAFYYQIGSDTAHVYWPATQKLLAGEIPYRDPRFFVEYPPLGTAVFVLPALLHPSSLRAFDFLFALEMLLVDVGALVLVAQLARRLAISATGAVAAYGLLVPLLGALVCQRYDLVPAALVLAALLALLDGRSLPAWTLLLLATLTKLYPAVLAPLFLLHEWRRGRRAGAILYAAGLVASVVAWYALAPGSLVRFAQWEGRRGIEIESSLGSLVNLAHRVVGLPVHIDATYGSYDVASALTPALKTLSTLLVATMLATIYLSYAWRTCDSARKVWGTKPGPPRTSARYRACLPAWTRGFPPAWMSVARHGLLPRWRASSQPGPSRWLHSVLPVASEGNAAGVAVSPSADVEEARGLVMYALLAVLGALLCGKLLSMQFLLWILPLVAVQPYRRGRVIALALGVVLLSQWIYPHHWRDLYTFKLGLVLLLLLRNGLLLALFVLIWRGRKALGPPIADYDS